MQGPEDDDDLLLDDLPQAALPDKLPSYANLEEAEGRLQKTARSNSNLSLHSDGSKNSKYSAPPEANEKVQTGADAAKKMLNLTAKIELATSRLYAGAEAQQEADRSDDYDRFRQESATSDSEDDSSQSSMKSWGRHKRESKQAGSTDHLDVEDYDINGAEERLYYMLSSLKNEKRTEIMTSLNHFYSNRSARVQQELEELDKCEGEHIAREEETADALSNMQKTFEQKNIREVTVLMQASTTLTAGCRGEVSTRQRFSKRGRTRSRLVDDLPADFSQLVWNPAKDISDQPPWDADHARSVWNRMNDKAVQISGGRANASQILEAMSVVQDGNLELESRAKLAKAAVETLQQVVEYLSKPPQGNQSDESEEGEGLLTEAVQACLDHLRERVLFTADTAEGGVEPPDPDELDEEVQELEKLVAEQKKQMDTYQRIRERNKRMREAEKAKALAEAKAAGGATSKDALGKMRAMAKNAVTIAHLSARARGQNKGEPEFKDDGKYDQDPRVVGLRETIKKKDEEMHKAQALLRRMRREKKLLKYCSQKAHAGFDSLAADFNPPKPDDPMNSDDSDELEEGQSAENPAGDSGNEASSPGEPAKDSGTEQPPSSRKKAESKEESSTELQNPEGTTNKASANRKSVAAGGKKKTVSALGSITPKPPALLEKIREVHEANNEQEKESEEKLEELSAKLSSDTTSLKEEKARSKVLRKEIKDLRKEFALMTAQDRSAPQNIEGLQERLDSEVQTERRIRAQIADLGRALNGQEHQMGAATAEQENAKTPIEPGTAAEASERLPQSPAQTTSSPEPLPQSQAQTTSSPEQRQDGTDEQRPASPQKQQQPQQEQRPASPQKQPQQDVPAAAAVETSEDTGSLAKTMLSMRRARALEAEKQVAVLVDQPENDGTAKQSLDSGGEQRSLVAPEVKKPRRFLTFAAEAEGEVESEIRETPAKTEAKRGITFAVPEDSSGPEAQEIEASPFWSALHSAKASKPHSAKKADDGGNDLLVELVKVQSKTEELRNEIADIDQKMKKLKVAMKQKGGRPILEVVKEIMGVSDEAANMQPPSEYFTVKKDLKAQQEKVRILRKRWWADRKDFEAIAEKVRNQVSAHSDVSGAGAARTSSTGDDKSKPPSFANLLAAGSGVAGGRASAVGGQIQMNGSAKQAIAAGVQMNAAMVPREFSSLCAGISTSGRRASVTGGQNQMNFSARQAMAAGVQQSSKQFSAGLQDIGSGQGSPSRLPSASEAAAMQIAMQRHTGQPRAASPTHSPAQRAASPIPLQFQAGSAEDHQARQAPSRNNMPGALSALSSSPTARGGPRQRFEQIKTNAAASASVEQAAAARSFSASKF